MLFEQEKKEWDDWFILVRKFYIYTISAVVVSIIFGGIILHLFDNDFGMKVFTIALFVLVYGPIYLIIKRPRNTNYLPNNILARHGGIATFFIFLGLLFGVLILLGSLARLL